MARTTLVAALVAAAMAALPASASPPRPTTFAVVEMFGDPPLPGVFTSNGSVVCTSGTTSNEVFGTGFQSQRGSIFHVRKTITCDDGSGTFTLLIQARLGFNAGDTTFGPWVVLRGTGDYTHLHGRGTVTGAPLPTGVSDVYEGWLVLR